jgi:hypothetical protein
MLDGLLHHKADEHFFEMVDAPILSLRIELLMRDTEKVSQLLRVIEPENMRESSRQEHFERDEAAFAEFLMKEREKPGKFSLPHGMILLSEGFACSWRILPKALRIKTPWESWWHWRRKVPCRRLVPTFSWARPHPRRRGTRRVT